MLETNFLMQYHTGQTKQIDGPEMISYFQPQEQEPKALSGYEESKTQNVLTLAENDCI